MVSDVLSDAAADIRESYLTGRGSDCLYPMYVTGTLMRAEIDAVLAAMDRLRIILDSQ